MSDTRRFRRDDRATLPSSACKVLDLLADGCSVVSGAHDLDISDQTVYNRRRQDRIDRSLEPGLTTAENAELTAARQRIAELETDSWWPVARSSYSRRRPAQKAIRGRPQPGRAADAPRRPSAHDRPAEGKHNIAIDLVQRDFT